MTKIPLKGIFCILFMHSNFAFAEIDPSMPDIIIPSEQHLYIDKIEQIKDMQTVTYFFTENSVPYNVKNMFKSFANSLGLNHGAIVISKNEEKYLSVSKLMKCDINTSSSDLVVFENRQIKNKDKQCLYFYINDVKNINNILAVVSKYKGDIEKMADYPNKFKLRSTVMNTCLATEWCKPYVKSMDSLIDMFLEKNT